MIEAPRILDQPGRPLLFHPPCVSGVMDPPKIMNLLSVQIVLSGREMQGVAAFCTVCWIQSGGLVGCFWLVGSSGTMDSSPESSASSSSALSVTAELQAIRRNLSRHKSYLKQIDNEGRRCLELVDRDLSCLREEFLESISQSESAMTRMMAELEVRFDKLELVVAKMAVGGVATTNYGQHGDAQDGVRMPAWFDLYEIPVTAESPRDEEGILKSVEKVHEMIDKEVATGISPSKIFVCGFSQGGALTLASAMLYPKTLGGAAVFSGWIPFNSSFIERISSEAKQTPVMWFHGMNDNVVEFSAGQAGPPLLERAGVSCQFKAYPGLGHSISPDELTSLESWIKARLQSSLD